MKKGMNGSMLAYDMTKCYLLAFTYLSIVLPMSSVRGIETDNIVYIYPERLFQSAFATRGKVKTIIRQYSIFQYLKKRMRK